MRFADQAKMLELVSSGLVCVFSWIVLGFLDIANDPRNHTKQH